ncbi:hypothetical protein MMC31_003693, partial [Peltigera leucophlebia]|nr:hypothetical protein [Peltigera leucophlebia]
GMAMVKLIKHPKAPSSWYGDGQTDELMKHLAVSMAMVKLIKGIAMDERTNGRTDEPMKQTEDLCSSYEAPRSIP